MPYPLAPSLNFNDISNILNKVGNFEARQYEPSNNSSQFITPTLIIEDRTTKKSIILSVEQDELLTWESVRNIADRLNLPRELFGLCS